MRYLASLPSLSSLAILGLASSRLAETTLAFTPSGATNTRAFSTTSSTASSSVLRESKSPFDAISGIGEVFQKEIGSLFQSRSKVPEKEKEKPKLPDVVIEPDFRLASFFLVGGILLDTIPYIQFTLGPLVTLLGLLFLVQTFRVRLCFDKEAFSLLVSDKSGDLDDTGENIVVGGQNRWTYDSFVNYDFFPKGWIDQPQGPILVYFKENQTPPDTWNEGPGKIGNSEEAIANGAKPGQIHFLPVLFNTQQLRAEFERRGCQKL